MRRDVLITAMVIFSALFTYGFVGARQGKDDLPVDVKPKPGKNDTQPYDPNKPPTGSTGKENGFCRWQTVAALSGAYDFSAVSASGTRTYTLTISKVGVSPRINITIYLPPEPPATATPEEKAKFATLKAHEEGHRDIAQKTFDLMNKDVFEKHCSKVKKVYTKTMPDPGNDKQAELDLYKEYLMALQPLVAAACSEIDTAIQGPSDAYDAATGHGTKGGDGTPSDPKNQDKAAKQASDDFKKQYKKP
jgi:hypothetical protein